MARGKQTAAQPAAKPGRQSKKPKTTATAAATGGGSKSPTKG